MTAFDHLESPLTPLPAFPVEPPDDNRDWAELPRQVSFLRDLRIVAPSVLAYANPNAGKRGPAAIRQAKAEGLRAGVFDLTLVWNFGTAWLEFKGYSQRRPGVLSAAQIDFGNALVERGQRCACFFSPVAALEWLREQGAPFVDRRL